MNKLEFEEMMANVDMEDWLSHEGIEFQKTPGTRGDQLNIQTCPFCGKSEYKVYLNAENGLGNCFSGSCQKGTFNKFSFIREYLSTISDNPKTTQYIANYVRDMGWRPRSVVSEKVEMKNKTLKLPEYLPIPIKGKNLKYLSDRRVDITIASYFHLGYVSKGYYGKRIFIPVHDIDGSLVSFQARDITQKAEQKYLFPPGFGATGKILYNSHNVLGKKHILMVEGVFDVIGAKLAMDEDENLREIGIVGSFGMSFTGNTTSGKDDQLSRLFKLKDQGLETVTIMWDPEAKALSKAVDAGMVFVSIGLSVRIAMLKENFDPGNAPPSMIRTSFLRAKALNQYTAMGLKMASII